MSKLMELHKLAAKVKILEEKYFAGVLTEKEFAEQMEKTNCHCHEDIVLDACHAEQDICYREIINNAMKMIKKGKS
jgi:hypothetical protein